MIEYREAVAQDLKALQELALVSYGILKPELTPENWTKMESILQSDQTFPLLLKTCYGFVCETDGRLIGMAFLVPSGNPTKIYSPDTSYIRMVGVHPDAGRKGIARSLTRLCIKKARESGEKKISLHSAEIMHAARHIYETEGFKKIKILDEHYGLVYWLYEMDLHS
jgi:ribosomal protein S18 acetylase RimI-like enzyme